MARKVVNRKQLREEAEAAENIETEAPKKKKKKRKSRKKAAAEIRMKVFWGVFTQSMKRVALYEFNQKKQAEKKAKELTASKTVHFVMKVKEPVDVDV